MSICSYGGAACCAGPSEAVKEHERTVHGKHCGGETKPTKQVNIAPKRRLSDAEAVELQRIYSKRYR